MSEADIIALTYEDSVSAYRSIKVLLPNNTSAFKKDLEGEKVYEDIPCALSSPSGGKLYKTVATAKVSTEYCLFVRPEIEILPNDYLVISSLGKEIVAEAGFAERMISHNNIPIKLKKDTV